MFYDGLLTALLTNSKQTNHSNIYQAGTEEQAQENLTPEPDRQDRSV